MSQDKESIPMADADRQSDSSARTGEASLNSVEAVTLFASDLPLVEKTEDAPVPEQVWHYGQQDWVEGVLLTEVDVPEMLPGNFSLGKKRYTLGSACFSQISMNLNASILPSAFQSLESSHGVSLGKLELSQSLFLIAYAFGCELWAPWSEDVLGRWLIMQSSLGLVNLWQVPQLVVICVFGLDHGKIVGNVILAMRVLAGLSSAGGSVTLGIIADLWPKNSQQRPTADLVFASCSGAIVGGVLGSFLQHFSSSVSVVAVQLGFGLVAQLLQWFTPETRSSVILTREARKRRKEGTAKVWSEAELAQLSWRTKEYWTNVLRTWVRPFYMLTTDPIVACLSLISGFSDALIFTFLFALPMVMKQWQFNAWQTGLCFVPIFIGYLMTWAFWKFVVIRYWSKRLDRLNAKPELRLQWLLWTAPLLPASMILFAWTARSGYPWICPVILLTFVGVANFAIYGSTVDYMIASYGEKYSASATGGNGFMRDLLAGVSTFYAKKLYSQVGPPHLHLPLGSTILACIAAIFTTPIFAFYYWGDKIRIHSKWAREVQMERENEKSAQPMVESGTA